jgi:hypothetical protein
LLDQIKNKDPHEESETDEENIEIHHLPFAPLELPTLQLHNLGESVNLCHS